MGPISFKLMFLGLMASGIPVAIAMAGASLVYVMVTGNVPDYVVIHRMVGGLDSFPLLAVPFFIMAGNLMNSAGITNRIYNLSLIHISEPTTFTWPRPPRIQPTSPRAKL